MTKWLQYAELDRFEVDNTYMIAACTTQDMLFIGGVNTETHNIVVIVADKPETIKENKDLVTMFNSNGVSRLMEKAHGKVTLGYQPFDSKPITIMDNVIDRIRNELKNGFHLNYAMRISALAQYPEYHDLQKAHETAVNLEKTTRVLKSKHPANKVEQFTEQSPVVENDLSF